MQYNWRICFLIFFTFYTGYPEISFSRPQYKIAFGRDVYLTCDLEETHPPLTKVWWTKYSPAGETDIEANSNKYEERYVPNKSTSINILSVDENDAGEYKCNARNAKGENFAKAMLLTGGKKCPYVLNLIDIKLLCFGLPIVTFKCENKHLHLSKYKYI